MLRLTQISHSFDQKPVLENFSLTLLPGERIALMGPSGVGKTTALRVAMGLLKPMKGQVENSFRDIAVVFQEPRLLPWRTAAENVNLVLGDKPGTMPRARQMLEELGLGDAAEKFPRELSGGMQQRVSIARALAGNAGLLILDEPFKAMDDHLRLQVIDRVARTHAAILLVTHDENEAHRLGCRIIRLK